MDLPNLDAGLSDLTFFMIRRNREQQSKDKEERRSFRKVALIPC